MNASGQEPSPTRPASKLYSVPRRYDLATLFAVSSAYALLFGVLRLFGAPPVAIGWAGLFISVVGLGQALLFGGRSPRAASVVVGVPVWCATVAWMVPRDGWETAFRELIYLPFAGICCGVIPGAILSYVAGAMVAGVFLVADKVRQRFEKRNSGKNADASPWAEETEPAADEETP
jgi:hypothetical protein